MLFEDPGEGGAEPSVIEVAGFIIESGSAI